MVILGALVNGIATVAGGTIGLAFKSRVSTRLGDFLMQGMGLVVLLVAISGMAKGGDIIVVVLSMIAGGILGYLVGIDGWIRRLGDWAQDRLTRAASGTRDVPVMPGSVFVSRTQHRFSASTMMSVREIPRHPSTL